MLAHIQYEILVSDLVSPFGYVENCGMQLGYLHSYLFLIRIGYAFQKITYHVASLYGGLHLPAAEDLHEEKV
jgi:hypothetical protein